MWAFYLFLSLVVGFVIWRLVQWFLLKAQLEREGRQIEKELDQFLRTFPQDKYPQDKYPQDRYPQDKYPQDKYPQDRYPQDKHKEVE